MTVKIKYICNLCEQRKSGKEIIGVYYDDTVEQKQLSIGVKSNTTSHICNTCIESIKKWPM